MAAAPSTLVIMVIWIYYASVVFLVGALLTAVIGERLRARREARAGVRAMGGRDGGMAS